MLSGKRGDDLVVLGKAPLALLREEQLAVGKDVELRVAALADLRLVLRPLTYLGRETRGPSVVTVSDGAVVDLDAHRPTRYSRRGVESAGAKAQTRDS